MVIIVTKAKAFSHGGVAGEMKTVTPSQKPITVPDWVRDTATFKLGAQDGSCVEVVIQPAAAEPAAPALPPKSEPEAAAAAIPAAPSAMRRKRKTA